MTYRAPTKVPCSDCPFRKKAAAGWLGASSPEGFIDCINREDILPCHQTIDYGDPDWKEKWVAQRTGNVCAGSLIMSANMGKLPRDPKFPRLPSDDGEKIFGSPLEFVQYHRASKVQSWDDDEQEPHLKALRGVFEQAAARKKKAARGV